MEGEATYRSRMDTTGVSSENQDTEAVNSQKSEPIKVTTSLADELKQKLIGNVFNK